MDCLDELDEYYIVVQNLCMNAESCTKHPDYGIHQLMIWHKH